jgi:hypothetical protein
VQELELSVDLRSLDKLLDFLSCSFMGGTDVDKPFELSLERLQKDEWQQVRTHACNGLFATCSCRMKSCRLVSGVVGTWVFGSDCVEVLRRRSRVCMISCSM